MSIPFIQKRKREKADLYPLLLILVMLCLWGVLHHVTGISFGGHSAYDSYTRQALAWRQGNNYVENASYLELAVKDGVYYVSFPPLPSVVEWVMTFFFGGNTPDNFLVKLYAVCACLLMYRTFKNVGYERSFAAAGAFFYTFASSFLPLTLEGAVWYHAQVLSFFLTTAAVCLFAEGKINTALLCGALAVGCRPFQALYILLLLIIFIRRYAADGFGMREMARDAWKGIAAGLLIAFVMAWYNFSRFGNPIEFGHNYLPEFSTQGGVQFSLSHIAKNIQTFWLGLPFSFSDGKLTMTKFGFSMFIACPALVIMIADFILDLFKKRCTFEKAATVLFMLVHMMLLLMHRTFGAFQYGARYAVDLLPYTFLYALLQKDRSRIPLGQILLLSAGFLLAFYGALIIHL